MSITNKYKGKTAGGLLKTATVAPSGAGLNEIWVPDAGRGVIAMIGERRDGFGGTVADVLVLCTSGGPIARIHTSPRAYRRLVSLNEAC